MLLALFGAPLFASEGTARHEVYGGYGFASLLHITSSILDDIAFSYSAPFTGAKSQSDQGSLGPVFLGYNYSYARHGFVGLVGSYEQVKTRWNYEDGHADWNLYFTSLMVRTGLTWGWEWVQVYHSLSLGGTYVDAANSDTTGYRRSAHKTIPAGHIALLGLRFGRGLGLFADVGIGTLGLVNFGASFKF